MNKDDALNAFKDAAKESEKELEELTPYLRRVGRGKRDIDRVRGRRATNGWGKYCRGSGKVYLDVCNAAVALQAGEINLEGR